MSRYEMTQNSHFKYLLSRFFTEFSPSGFKPEKGIQKSIHHIQNTFSTLSCFFKHSMKCITCNIDPQYGVSSFLGPQYFGAAYAGFIIIFFSQILHSLFMIINRNPSLNSFGKPHIVAVEGLILCTCGQWSSDAELFLLHSLGFLFESRPGRRPKIIPKFSLHIA